MHKSVYFLGNETNKILCNFEIKSDHLIPVRRRDQVTFNKNEKKKKKKKKKLLNFEFSDILLHSPNQRN